MATASKKGMCSVGMLAWLVPGAGHWYLGMRGRGVVIFVAICTMFVLGLALGGLEVVDPENSKPWFVAQIVSGLPAIISTLMQKPQMAAGYGRGVDLGQVYAGVAGLLNLLCLLDALARCRLACQAEQPGQSKR